MLQSIIALGLSLGLSAAYFAKMAKDISWDEYSIRTLAYYRKQRGVYGTLIKILQRASTSKSILDYVPWHTPAMILNIASYIADLAMADQGNSAKLIVEKKKRNGNGLKQDQDLIFSIVYIIIADTDCDGAKRKLMDYIGTSPIYDKLLVAYQEEVGKGASSRKPSLGSGQITEYAATIRQNEQAIKTKDRIIDSQNAIIADQSKRIDEMQKIISRLEKEKDLAQAAAFHVSVLDKTLTLDYIISQIELRRTYDNSRQLIDLLKGKLMRIATDEEVAKIVQVEQRMLDASVPSIHNDIRNSHVFQAPVHNPTFQLPIGFTEEKLKEAIEQYLKRKNDGYTE